MLYIKIKERENAGQKTNKTKHQKFSVLATGSEIHQTYIFMTRSPLMIAEIILFPPNLASVTTVTYNILFTHAHRA